MARFTGASCLTRIWAGGSARTLAPSAYALDKPPLPSPPGGPSGANSQSGRSANSLQVFQGLRFDTFHYTTTNLRLLPAPAVGINHAPAEIRDAIPLQYSGPLPPINPLACPPHPHGLVLILPSALLRLAGQLRLHVVRLVRQAHPPGARPFRRRRCSRCVQDQSDPLDTNPPLAPGPVHPRPCHLTINTIHHCPFRLLVLASTSWIVQFFGFSFFAC